MNLVVFGSRDFNDYEKFCEIIDPIPMNIIISGGARGVDSLAKKYAWEEEVLFKEILADWDKFGRGAGFIRNKEMWDIADCGVCFWDGTSKGTKHSIDIGISQGKRVIIYNYLTNEISDTSKTIEEW